MKRLLLFAAVHFAVTAHAQIPQLAEDIVAGSAASDPQRLTIFNDKIYFTAIDAAHGRELWEWHAMGTPAVRITDLWTGSGNGTPGTGASETMYVSNGKLYFAATSNNTTLYLMAYNGINPPTVVRMHTGSGGYLPAKMVQYGSKLYFVDDSVANYVGYLYSYNGISAPVQLGHGYANNWMGGMMPYKGKLYGECDDKIHGGELTAYDTATGQLSLVADLFPGKYSGGADQFLVYGGKLYFIGNDSACACGRELFSYDGTTLKRLTDIMPVTGGIAGGVTFVGGRQRLVVFKGQIYFSGENKADHHVLYKYDTATKVASVAYDPAPGLYTNYYPSNMFATSNNLYFYYKHPNTGSELFAYNGASGKLVADLNPGKADGAGFSNMVLYHNNVYFCGNNGTTGNELYRLFDGESAGMQRSGWNGEVVLHPNPATTSTTLSITLQSALPLRISLTDISGKELFSTGIRSLTAGRNDIRLPMQSLAAGQYFYRISGNDGATLAGGVVVKE